MEQAGRINPKKYYIINWLTNEVIISRGAFNTYQDARKKPLPKRWSPMPGDVVITNLSLGNIKLEAEIQK